MCVAWSFINIRGDLCARDARKNSYCTPHDALTISTTSTNIHYGSDGQKASAAIYPKQLRYRDSKITLLLKYAFFASYCLCLVLFFCVAWSLKFCNTTGLVYNWTSGWVVPNELCFSYYQNVSLKTHSHKEPVPQHVIFLVKRPIKFSVTRFFVVDNFVAFLLCLYSILQFSFVVTSLTFLLYASFAFYILASVTCSSFFFLRSQKVWHMCCILLSTVFNIIILHFSHSTQMT